MIEDLKQPVLQWWVLSLPWKMQTVLIQGLRAPDGHFCIKIKIVSRWLRSVVLNNADKNHSFMCRKKKLPKWERLENELNYCSLHFVTHFLYALEIVGYKHTNQEVRETALNYYQHIVEDMSHLKIEPESQLDIRLADVEDVPPLSEHLEEFGRRLKERELSLQYHKTKYPTWDWDSQPPKACPVPDRYLRS